jgi:hypothetical protein
MDADKFARLLRQQALKAHGMLADGASREELIELRGGFVDMLAAAPEGKVDVRRWIETVVGTLSVQTASNRLAKRAKRYWVVGGTRRVKRSQVRLVVA